MKDTLAQVRAAYDHDPEWEWRRLESGAQYRLEHLVTMHALKRHLPETGIAAIGPGGAPTYYFLPEELVASLAAADLEPVRLYGCNGLGAHLPEEHLNSLMADPVRWPVWRKQLLANCDHPNIVGVSNHLLAVARRPAQPTTRRDTELG